MNREYQQHPAEEYDEAALKLLMREHAAREADALWRAFEQAQQDGTAPEMPQELDEACRNLIHNAKRTHSHSLTLESTTPMLKRAAVFALTTLILCSTVVMSVDAVRLPVLNYFVSNKERYSSIIFNNSSIEKADQALLDQILLIPPPENCFIASENKKTDGSFTLEYEGPNGATVQTSFFFSDGIFSYDTEDIDPISMNIYGKDAFYIQKKGNRIFWYDAEIGGIFDIRSQGISDDAFWKYVHRLAE